MLDRSGLGDLDHATPDRQVTVGVVGVEDRERDAGSCRMFLSLTRPRAELTTQRARGSLTARRWRAREGAGVGRVSMRFSLRRDQAWSTSLLGFRRPPRSRALSRPRGRLSTLDLSWTTRTPPHPSLRARRPRRSSPSPASPSAPSVLGLLARPAGTTEKPTQRLVNLLPNDLLNHGNEVGLSWHAISLQGGRIDDFRIDVQTRNHG